MELLPGFQGSWSGLFDIDTFFLLLSCVWIDYLTHSLHPWIQLKCRCILTWIIPVEVKTQVSSWISSLTQCFFDIMPARADTLFGFCRKPKRHLTLVGSSWISSRRCCFMSNQLLPCGSWLTFYLFISCFRGNSYLRCLYYSDHFKGVLTVNPSLVLFLTKTTWFT